METEELINEARAYVREVWEDVERDIDDLIQVESVEDLEHAKEGMPYGPAVREALDRALAIAENLGLETHNCDGHIGYADVAGKSEQYYATIAHADIVPLGSGWHFDPLRLSSKDGYLIGRGVLDDKGPLVLSLYAARFVAQKARELGRELPYTLRCIVGVNEETGMRDVGYFTEHFPQPLFCFTPDACFPAICGEKGRVHAELASPELKTMEGRIVSLAGGEASNAIVGCAEAVVVASPEDLPAREGIEVVSAGTDEQGRELLRVVAHGKGGHAAMPEETHSAVGMLCEVLLQSGICSDVERAFLELQTLVFMDVQGKALGIDASDEVFDPLTCAGTIVSTHADATSRRLVQTLDIRYPSSVSADHIASNLAEVAARFGCEVRIIDSSVPFLTSPDSPEVQVLLDAYRDVFNREGDAFTIGGGTYARHFDKAVAFGPLDPRDGNDPDWVGPEHGPDEGIRQSSLKRALQTYVVALSRLMGL